MTDTRSVFSAASTNYSTAVSSGLTDTEDLCNRHQYKLNKELLHNNSKLSTMAANLLLGLSVVQLTSLIAAILTILVIGGQGIVNAKQKGPRVVNRVRSFLWEAITRRTLRPFWGPFIRDGGTLILPTKDHTDVESQPVWMRTMFLDYFGAAHLLEELNTAFDTTNIGWTQSDTISQEQRNQNLISVAGPQPNQITATLLQQPEIVYQFPRSDQTSKTADYQGFITSEISSDTVFEPMEQNGSIYRDFGVITKMKTHIISSRMRLLYVVSGDGEQRLVLNS